MKKMYSLMVLCSLFLITSCSHTLYNTKTLQGNYDIQMNSKEELEIKSKVQIFLSEKDIQGEYEIISVAHYKPAFAIPILYTQKSQINKKFYEKAVKKAYKRGGNGILIMAGGFYKIISLHNWDSDNTATAQYSNAILDTQLMDIFTSGNITKLSAREVKRYVTDLDNEIAFNLKSIKTSQEAKVVGQKIETLMQWNNSQPKLDKTLDKKLEGYRTVHKALERKILKKESK